MWYLDIFTYQKSAIQKMKSFFAYSIQLGKHWHKLVYEIKFIDQMTRSKRAKNKAFLNQSENDSDALK